MENSNEVISPTTAAVDATEPSSPTTTFYDQLAAQLSAAVEQTISQIPGYNDDLSGIPKTARRLVTPQFIAMTVAATKSSEELTGVNQIDINQTRDDAQFSDAFQPLTDQLRGFVRRLDLMMKVKDVRAGRSALSVYHIARRLTLNSNNTKLAVHVANLKAELKRKRTKKTATTTPAPSPQTPAAPAPAPDASQKGGAPAA